jgi:hypothetical protein
VNLLGDDCNGCACHAAPAVQALPRCEQVLTFDSISIRQSDGQDPFRLLQQHDFATLRHCRQLRELTLGASDGAEVANALMLHELPSPLFALTSLSISSLGGAHPIGLFETQPRLTARPCFCGAHITGVIREALKLC